MMLSETAYQKAKIILAFVASHPFCTVQEISEAADYPMRRTHAALKKLTNAGVLATQRETIPYGYRLQYRVTDKPLPDRTPVRAKRAAPPDYQIKANAIPMAEWIRLPALVRAITPVIEQPSNNGAVGL